MYWVDPTDPEVFAAVAGFSYDEETYGEFIAAVSQAVLSASEILTLATGFGVHPAGANTEEFLGPERVRSLTLMRNPVTLIQSVVTVDPASGAETPTSKTFRLVGNTIIFFGQAGGSTSRLVAVRRPGGSACGPNQLIYRVNYTYGSTISSAARSAVLAYARELYLSASDPNECSLPERVTSITREGVGIELMTPQDFLDKGRVGLPSVDTWLAQINPKRALRPSAVYTPDSPPGVGIRRSS